MRLGAVCCPTPYDLAEGGHGGAHQPSHGQIMCRSFGRKDPTLDSDAKIVAVSPPLKRRLPTPASSAHHSRIASMILCCGLDGCVLRPDHDGPHVEANLCGVDPNMSAESRRALDGVLQAASAHLKTRA